MKKRVIAIVMMIAVCGSLVTGCSNREKEENKEAYRQIGINCMQEGDYDGAISAFQKALDQSLAKIEESEVDTCYYKAMAQYAGGYVEDAIETYSALIHYDKKNATAYYLRGNVYLSEGDIKSALTDYDAAAAEAGKDYELYIAMADKLQSVGEDTQAEVYLNEALKQSGKSGRDYTQRGRIYLMQGDYEKAKSELNTAIEKEDSEAQLYLGQLYEAQGDMDSAKPLFEAYVKENADNTEALNSLGCMQMKNGNYAEAVTYLEQAMESKSLSNEQEVRRNLIMAYEYSGDFESAKSTMESYVTDYPNDADAQRDYEFLQTR